MSGIPRGLQKDESDNLPLPSFQELFPEHSSMKKRRRRSQSSKDKYEGTESAGRWTVEEHKLFLQGVNMYGKDWKAMIPLIKTRSLRQIRTHAQKVLKGMYAKSKDSKTPQQMELGDNLSADQMEAGDNLSADSSANSDDNISFKMDVSNCTDVDIS